ncbi:MAG: Ig-like domain-containing protein [Gemmataceae bacterium]|nr:Ig-like domain-containing protein [Gemmataceae bacterium]
MPASLGRKPPAGAAPASAPVLERIRLFPDNLVLHFGQPRQFEAKGWFSDGGVYFLTENLDWRSSHPNIVSIDDNGIATAGHKAGTAQISATDKATKVTGSIEVTVEAQLFLKAKFSRGLNAAERSKAQSLFQNSLDYDQVTIFSGGLGPAFTGARTIGNKVYIRAKFFKENSTELTPKGMELLIHELGHVWQYQHGGLAYIPNALAAQATGKAYRNAWRRVLSKPWEEWNAEQQAEALEDYARAKERVDAAKSDGQTPVTADLDMVRDLQPYVDKARAGKGAPGDRGKK